MRRASCPRGRARVTRERRPPEQHDGECQERQHRQRAGNDRDHGQHACNDAEQRQHACGGVLPGRAQPACDGAEEHDRTRRPAVATADEPDVPALMGRCEREHRERGQHGRREVLPSECHSPHLPFARRSPRASAATIGGRADRDYGFSTATPRRERGRARAARARRDASSSPTRCRTTRAPSPACRRRRSSAAHRRSRSTAT